MGVYENDARYYEVIGYTCKPLFRYGLGTYLLTGTSLDVVLGSDGT